MPASILPIIFVFLWASAFISAKAIMADGTAFISLALRFSIVGVGFAGATFIFARHKKMTIWQIFHAAITGILLHGFYLGGVFWALSHNMPATNISLDYLASACFHRTSSWPLIRGTYHHNAMGRHRNGICWHDYCHRL